MTLDGSRTVTTMNTPHSADLLHARLTGSACLALAAAFVLIALVVLSPSEPAQAGPSASTPAAVTTAGATESVANDAAPTAAEEPVLEDQVVVAHISPGDTLGARLTDAGVEGADAHKAILALRDVFDPRQIKPKQDLRITLRPDPETGTPLLTEVRLAVTPVHDVIVRREENDGFAAESREKALDTVPIRREAVIHDSLYMAAVNHGIPAPLIGKMIDIFSFDVDFQREIHTGDSFALLYEEQRTKDGSFTQPGQVLMAELTLRGETRRYYRFETPEGVDYFDAKGRSVRKALLKTPVDGARISSPFGMRRHPIQGFTKMHKGVDFAASPGTPIHAAGDGVVARAGRNGGYGNYVEIRHNATYSTAYAHMLRFAKGIHSGSRVKQRQVIGYVGSTGSSTGPHLHYEIVKNGAKVNPLDVRLPIGKTLSAGSMIAFQKARGALETLYASLPATPTTARNIDLAALSIPPRSRPS